MNDRILDAFNFDAVVEWNNVNTLDFEIGECILKIYPKNYNIPMYFVIFLTLYSKEHINRGGFRGGPRGT